MYSSKVKQSENPNFLVISSNYRSRYFKILNFQRIFNQSLWKNYLKKFFGKKYSNIEKSEVFRVSFEVKYKVKRCHLYLLSHFRVLKQLKLTVITFGSEWIDQKCIHFYIGSDWTIWGHLTTTLNSPLPKVV